MVVGGWEVEQLVNILQEHFVSSLPDQHKSFDFMKYCQIFPNTDFFHVTVEHDN